MNLNNLVLYIYILIVLYNSTFTNQTAVTHTKWNGMYRYKSTVHIFFYFLQHQHYRTVFRYQFWITSAPCRCLAKSFTTVFTLVKIYAHGVSNVRLEDTQSKINLDKIYQNRLFCQKIKQETYTYVCFITVK